MILFQSKNICFGLCGRGVVCDSTAVRGVAVGSRVCARKAYGAGGDDCVNKVSFLLVTLGT